jgi:murein DD-endopeptidase MepM/ murein hydrolase activator NlpD
LLATYRATRGARGDAEEQLEGLASEYAAIRAAIDVELAREQERRSETERPAEEQRGAEEQRHVQERRRLAEDREHEQAVEPAAARGREEERRTRPAEDAAVAARAREAAAARELEAARRSTELEQGETGRTQAADTARQREQEAARQRERDAQRQAEAARQARLQAERQAEEERQQQAEEERQRQAEEERQRQAEEERQREAELDRQRRAEAQRQAEAERQAAAVAASGWVRPVPGPVTSGFGPRWSSFHYGVDIAAPIGTTTVAARAGTVGRVVPTCPPTVRSDPCGGGFGNYVTIVHSDGMASLYAHLSTVVVAVGERVATGQVIGATGNSGNSLGPHLHLEVWSASGTRLDPCSHVPC